jgi:hypothetical protein
MTISEQGATRAVGLGARDGSAERRDHLVEDTASHVADEVGELLDAHLDALSEVIGDDDPAFGDSGVVDLELRAATAALSAERGDVAQGGVLHGGVPFSGSSDAFSKRRLRDPSFLRKVSQLESVFWRVRRASAHA